MATAKEILTAVDSIAAFYNPLMILVFGSYAYGTPNYDSDVDFLVLKNFSGTEHEHYVKIRTAVNFPFAVDLLVRRPDVVKQRIKWNDFFLQEIMEKGIVLYAANDKGMGDQGRRRLRRRLAALKIQEEKPVRSHLPALSAVH
jgi:predicted nucleotidyltransferase